MFVFNFEFLYLLLAHEKYPHPSYASAAIPKQGWNIKRK